MAKKKKRRKLIPEGRHGVEEAVVRKEEDLVGVRVGGGRRFKEKGLPERKGGQRS